MPRRRWRRGAVAGRRTDWCSRNPLALRLDFDLGRFIDDDDRATDALLDHGATLVTGYITHGVLSGGAVARIMGSGLKDLVITDSIMPSESVRNAKNIRVLPTAPLLGEAIARTAEEKSVSSLFY